MPDNLLTPKHLILLPVMLGIYLIPTFISMARKHPNHVIIASINIFLGGTGIGWIIALLWALNPQVVLGHQSTVTQR
jgi:Superinfection immunity protein